MPKPLTQSQAQALSTNADVKYLWSTFLDECTDPVLGAWVDPLSVKVHLLLEAKKTMMPIQLTEKKPITTLSWELYGTTSMWAVILYLNGYMHPDEIPPGATLLVPSLASIDSLRAEAEIATSNYGKSFVV